MNYQYALIFTKKGNMQSYYEHKFNSPGPNCPAAKLEREIQCIVFYRWEDSCLFCRVKCPVSPLPIKGEFMAPSLNVIKRWFFDNDWKLKATIPL